MGGRFDHVNRGSFRKLFPRVNPFGRSGRGSFRRHRFDPAGAVRWALGSVLDFLVADSCALCGRSSDRWERGEAVVGPARHLVEPLEVRCLFGAVATVNHPVCTRCAAELVVARSTGALGRLVEPFVIETASGERFGNASDGNEGEMPLDSPAGRTVSVVAPFMTTEATLKIVHLLKFGGYADLARPIARTMVWAVRRLGAEPDDDWILVPTPMDKRSRRRRGFNQAEQLARRLADELGAAVELDVLDKTARTRRQSRMKREHRARNVRGAFSCPRSARPRLAGRSVLLVDDLVTTGATAAECAAALLDGGSGSVTVVSFGRAI